MRWTSEQEEILFIHGHRGPGVCRDIIYREFGIYRSVHATERHANRIGASMIRYQTCPQCGRTVRRLNRNSGTCDACNYDRLWREQVEEEQRILEAFRKGGESNAVSQAKRRYDAQRQKVARTRKRICGDFAGLSENLSVPSSEPQKKFRDLFDSPPEKEVCAHA